jgi:beta-1,4-mannosyltransferase
LGNTRLQKILVLPDAGPENPFQYQMIAFLRINGFEVRTGKKRKFGSIYSHVKDFDPEIVYFDWVHSFILGRSLVWSYIKSLLFIAEIIYLSSIKKIKIIHTLHNTQNHLQLRLSLERVVYVFFLKHCSKIRVYSEAVKQEAVQQFNISPDRISIIQDIPYHQYYISSNTKKNSREHLNIEETAFVFLFFGRIKTYKGLENLIQSFLSTARQDDCLLIAGANTDQEYVLKLKSLSCHDPKIIWFDRFIAKEEVQYFFNAADIVVLPFIRIDHSGTIDLAMSFRKPVITLKTDATKALLAHQEILLFEIPQDLADSLVKAHQVNTEEIGFQNFTIADSSNYHELLPWFQKA